jgi:hypothetical protein
MTKLILLNQIEIMRAMRFILLVESNDRQGIEHRHVLHDRVLLAGTT